MSNTDLFGSAETYQNAETRFIEVGGVRIAYRSFGQGEPLIFLQRFRGGMDDWDPGFLNPLGATRRVITFDSAGVGESAGQVPLDLEGAADVAVAFMRTLGLESADVAGWSMGGMTAQIVAAKHPDAVRRLILIGTLPPGGSPEIVPASDEWAGLAAKPQYTPEDILSLFFSASIEGRTAGWASLDRISELRPATDMKTTLEVAQIHGEAIAGFYRNDGGWYARLRDIKARTLVVNGDKDGAFPAIDSVVLGREIPNAEVVLYPDSGHGAQFQYPDRVAGDIDDFLRRTQAA